VIPETCHGSYEISPVQCTMGSEICTLYQTQNLRLPVRKRCSHKVGGRVRLDHLPAVIGAAAVVGRGGGLGLRSVRLVQGARRPRGSLPGQCTSAQQQQPDMLQERVCPPRFIRVRPADRHSQGEEQVLHPARRHSTHNLTLACEKLSSLTRFRSRHKSHSRPSPRPCLESQGRAVPELSHLRPYLSLRGGDSCSAASRSSRLASASARRFAAARPAASSGWCGAMPANSAASMRDCRAGRAPAPPGLSPAAGSAASRACSAFSRRLASPTCKQPKRAAEAGSNNRHEHCYC